MKKIIIGIDPGKSGGIGVYDGYTDKYKAYNCPDTIEGMVKIIEEWSNKASNVVCYLERVHAFPTDGKSVAFKFGMNYGIWQGILESFKIKTTLVVPQKWQKHFGDFPKIKKERKAKLKEIANSRSGLKTTLKTADAILICEYGKDDVPENS